MSATLASGQDDAQLKLSLLEDIAGLINRSHDLQATLDNIVILICERMRTDVCSIYLWNESDRSLELKATVGLNKEKAASVRLRLGEGLTSLAMERMQPVMTSNASAHPRYRYFPEIGEEAFDTFLGVPLIERGSPIGVIVVQSRESRPITPNDVRMLSTLATQLTAVIRNATIFDAIATGRDTAYLQGLLQPTPRQEKKQDAGPLVPPPPFVKGKPVGRGFALGSAHLASGREEGQEIPLSPGDIPAALERLAHAVEESKSQVRRVQREYAETFSEELAGIFTTHQMILEDDAFIERIRENVRKGHPPARAVEGVMDYYNDLFSRVEDPYLKERALDLRDISNRIKDNLHGRKPEEGGKDLTGRIVFTEELTPSLVVQYHSEDVAAIVSSHGGATSHAAILAESLRIPMVVGVPFDTLGIHEDDTVIVDANLGMIYIRPAEALISEYARARHNYIELQKELVRQDELPPVTTDGQRISLMANIGFLTDLKFLDTCQVEGIGLYRTEFPFLHRLTPPSEAEQVAIYSKVVDWAKGRPVTIRALDIGGDKRIPYIKVESESNPALGLCSIRLALSNRDLFKTQLRAILRVGAEGNVRLLLPMVTDLEEITAVQALLRECEQELLREGIAFHPNLPLGIMVEVPATALILDRLAEHADFFAVGTNDLIQFTLAVDRGNERVSRYYDPMNTAILRLLQQIFDVGRRHGKDVSVCGEMAADPAAALVLIGMGLKILSMNPVKIPLVKRAIRTVALKDARSLAMQVMDTASNEDRSTLLRSTMTEWGLERYQ